eukprot:jgi/Botrbrau1/5741/Bobra.0134s0015.1
MPPPANMTVTSVSSTTTPMKHQQVLSFTANSASLAQAAQALVLPAEMSKETLEKPTNGELVWQQAYQTQELPRSYAQDPDTWLRELSSTTPLGANRALNDKQLADYLSLCADIVQTTYSCYKNTAKPATKEQPKPKPTGQPAYSPSQLSQVPPLELRVEESSPARSYIPGVAGPDGRLTEDDSTFYLVGTSGIFSGEFKGAVVSWEESNWMGYVSIGPQVDGAPGLNIMINFRGTIAQSEWLSDIVAGMVPWMAAESESWAHQLATFVVGQYRCKDAIVPVEANCLPEFHPILKKAYVARGFEQMYRRFVHTPGNSLSMQGQVQVAVRKLLAKYGDSVSSITVTGHSLGGALATLCAFDLSASGINRQGDSKKGALVPITCITINAPRVGNWAFADFFKVPKGPRHLRLFNTGDIVPRVPYIGWGNGGVLFRFLWWAAILPSTIQEVFGKNAGNDFPRDVKAEKFRRYVYQHSGHGVPVATDWHEENWKVDLLRKVTGLPYLFNPAHLHPDFSLRHSFIRLMAVVSPNTWGNYGRKSLHFTN